MQPDKIHGAVDHKHSPSDLSTTTTTPTITDSLALNMAAADIVKAASYADNTAQTAFTVTVSKDVVGKSCVLMTGKMASGAAVTLPAGAEIVSGAWSNTYRNVAELFCYAAGKYMVSITQKTAA